MKAGAWEPSSRAPSYESANGMNDVTEVLEESHARTAK